MTVDAWSVFKRLCTGSIFMKLNHISSGGRIIMVKSASSKS